MAKDWPAEVDGLPSEMLRAGAFIIDGEFSGRCVGGAWDPEVAERVFLAMLDYAPADLLRRWLEAEDLQQREGALLGDSDIDLNAPIEGPIALDCPAKFDPVAEYDRLPPALQRRMGAAGVLLAYATRFSVAVDGRRAIAFEAAEIEAARLIQAALPPVTLRPGEPPPLPNLGVLGVRACRQCGCTDTVGCPGFYPGETCRWVGPDLCSACDRLSGMRR